MIEYAGHICTSSDMHPYECDGPGKCVHCDRRRLKGHKPSKCFLCHETLKRHPKNCTMCQADNEARL